jgi:hypothetical protein
MEHEAYLSIVADQAKRPFLRIQAETLDEDDMQLDEAFELATEWDALLLIDGKIDVLSKYTKILLMIWQKRMHTSGATAKKASARAW